MRFLAKRYYTRNQIIYLILVLFKTKLGTLVEKEVPFFLRIFSVAFHA